MATKPAYPRRSFLSEYRISHCSGPLLCADPHVAAKVGCDAAIILNEILCAFESVVFDYCWHTANASEPRFITEISDEKLWHEFENFDAPINAEELGNALGKLVDSKYIFLKKTHRGTYLIATSLSYHSEQFLNERKEENVKKQQQESAERKRKVAEKKQKSLQAKQHLTHGQ